MDVAVFFSGLLFLRRWKDSSHFSISASEAPVVLIYISYKAGLRGKNVLILKEQDVKIITDLMMGGDGTNIDDAELNDLHLSAICEAMNQMMGSAATSMSSMINEMVDISPPTATRVDFGDGLVKPLILILLEECKAAGIEEICTVLNEMGLKWDENGVIVKC